MLGHASDNQGNAYPPPPSSLPQRKGRQVLVAVSLAFETRGGALDNEADVSELSSARPWGPGLGSSKRIFVECSLSSVAPPVCLLSAPCFAQPYE